MGKFIKSELEAIFGKNSENNPYRRRVEEALRRRDEADRAVFLPIALVALWIVFALCTLVAFIYLSSEWSSVVGIAFAVGSLMFPVAYIVLRPKNYTYVPDGDLNTGLEDQGATQPRKLGGVDDPAFTDNSLYVLPGMSTVIDDDDK